MQEEEEAVRPLVSITAVEFTAWLVQQVGISQYKTDMSQL